MMWLSRYSCLTLLLAVSSATAAPAKKTQTDAGKGPTRSERRGIKRTFHRLKLGIRQENEIYFKSGWVPGGYEKNLTGSRASMAGRAFFDLYGRRRWLIRPKQDRIQSLPGRSGRPFVVPCLVWSGKRNKALATLYTLLVYSKKRQRWKVLGASGRKQDVIVLGERYVAKKIRVE